MANQFITTTQTETKSKKPKTALGVTKQKKFDASFKLASKWKEK